MPFLDWTRGMAATIMLQGHVFHSFVAVPRLRESGPTSFRNSSVGIAPAIFLFLTGVTSGVHDARHGAQAGQRYGRVDDGAPSGRLSRRAGVCVPFSVVPVRISVQPRARTC